MGGGERVRNSLNAASPTEALADVQQACDGDVMAMVVRTRPLDGHGGVPAAIGGEVRSIDLFDRTKTLGLGAYWDALVSGYALDAVGLATEPVPPGRRAVVHAFTDLRAARTRRVAGIGLARRVHAAGPAVTAGALVWDDVCVHLALHRVAAGPSGPGVRLTPSVALGETRLSHRIRIVTT